MLRMYDEELFNVLHFKRKSVTLRNKLMIPYVIVIASLLLFDFCFRSVDFMDAA